MSSFGYLMGMYAQLNKCELWVFTAARLTKTVSSLSEIK